MKKKFVLSVLTTASLLFVSAGAAGAEGVRADNIGQKKVEVYQSSGQNVMKLNEYLQKYLQNCQIKWNSMNTGKGTQQPAKPAEKPTATPVQQEPAQQPNGTINESNQASDMAQLSAFEQQVVDLTNQERAKQGLPALKVDEQLSKVARAKSVDMQTKGYFSHTSPTYGSPFDMMKQFGISFRGAGENIAMGQRSSQEVVNSWMNSSGHRANILNSSFTHIGVGYAENGNYWTQMFITK